MDVRPAGIAIIPDATRTYVTGHDTDDVIEFCPAGEYSPRTRKCDDRQPTPNGWRLLGGGVAHAAEEQDGAGGHVSNGEQARFADQLPLLLAIVDFADS